MAFDDTSTDFSDDITLPLGCDLSYAYSLQPFDGTGCTAQFITDVGTFSVAIAVDVEGDQSVTTFTVAEPANSFTVPGLYAWKLRVTFPGGQVLPYGHGGFLVEGS